LADVCQLSVALYRQVLLLQLMLRRLLRQPLRHCIQRVVKLSLKQHLAAVAAAHNINVAAFLQSPYLRIVGKGSSSSSSGASHPRKASDMCQFFLDVLYSPPAAYSWHVAAAYLSAISRP
jgi:hypothetical protein